MKTRLILLAGVASAFGAAASAPAATVVLNSGTPYTYVVHANSAGAGTSLGLQTKNIVSPVTLSSSDMIDVGNGNGVAQANGVGKKDGFADITIDPLLNFSVMQFKIEGPTGNTPGHDLDIFIEFGGGGSQTISNFILPSNDKLDVFAGPGEVMTRITLLGLRNSAGAALDFRALKQVSFEAVQAAVPEPASWAMMIGGFGLLGAAVRRRQRTNVTFA